MPSPAARVVLPLFFCLCANFSCLAQAPAPQSQGSGFSQTASSADEGALVRLPGSVHPLARAENDRGPVDDAFPAKRMVVLLNPPAERLRALQQFLRDAHTPGVASFHQWLTPAQFGAQFGARDEDVLTVQTWLASHGFAVTRLAKSRRALEFSGTAGQVREGLHAAIHQYELRGKTYYSVASDVSVPAAIAPLLKGFAPLNNFPLNSGVRTTGMATVSRAMHGATPLYTTTQNGAPFYGVTPEDFATQYDLEPAYQAGINGSGQTIGIIGELNINLNLVDFYRKLFNLPQGNTQVVVDGEDPGDSATPLAPIYPVGESYLAVELSGAVAPQASVNYYVAQSALFQNPFALAAMRAVEDNQASVLSVTFGDCEQLLGKSGNQFWATLWEQAAAQGQTVLVSSGNEGPAQCGPAIVTEVNGVIQTIDIGLTVNGLASTPWNVAVGATDFYYSDYATGGASVATLWNAINDANLGSLKAPLPEQPWDDQLGLNIPQPPVSLTGGIGTGASAFVGVSFGTATGGGASNCAQQGTATPPLLFDCVSGYSKPSWQNAPGVPADGVRDLPDLALFGGDGNNLSAYVLCMEPGDCGETGGGQTQVSLAGGFGAPTPAMAGIMALVNQKFGRQGQANYVLYALANQQPSVFHDVTVGTNDVYCISSSPICQSSPLGVFKIPSYGVYAAAAGYDLASGLGSLDVSVLLTNWNKISFAPTSTTLQLSPATITHGAAVSITAAVKAGSGSAVPSGDVSIETSSTTPLLQSPAMTLSGGAASANWTSFPGGTYQVTARYGGDGTFGSSTSAPVALTVSAEPSATALMLQYQYEQLTAPPAVVHSGTLANGGQVPFGSRFTFTATPTGQTSLSSGDATGTATFTDGANSVVVPLGVHGVATWSPYTLSTGAHTVTVDYSGDASYAASTSSALSFTVTSGNLLVTTELQAPIVSLAGAPATIDYQAGASAVLSVRLLASNTSVPPTGNVTVNFGSMTQTVALVAVASASEVFSNASITIPNVAAGTYAVTVSYAGDSNWGPSTSAAQNYTFVSTPTASAATATTLTLSPSSADSSGAVTFTATVTSTQAQSGPPVGDVLLYANGYNFGTVNLPYLTTGQVATGSVTLPASGIPSGALQVTGFYLGAAGQFTAFQSSTSAGVALNITLSDFTLAPSVASLTIKSGQSGALPLLLGGPNGGTPVVSLFCLPSTTNFGCSVSPSAPTVKGATTAMLTVNAFILATGTASAWPTGGLPRSVLVSRIALILATGGLLVFSVRKNRRVVLASFAGIACVVLLAACGGGSITMSPPPMQANAPPGSYSITVTAISGNITHNVKIAVVVQ